MTTIAKPATALDPQRCHLPGCSNLVEQPAGGGQRKRFCCDAHRVQFWRQTRERPSAAEAWSGSQPPALALKSQLEQSVQALEGVVARARTTLIELANLEEAEAIRTEALSSADEIVARAQGERAAEERRRRAAEGLAEAATRAAQEAEAGAKEAWAKTAQVEAELAVLRDEVAALEHSFQEQIAEARSRAEARIWELQDAAAAAAEEARSATAAQAAAEQDARQAKTELELAQVSLRGSQERSVDLERRLESESDRYRRELDLAAERQDALQNRLETALADWRREAEARARAESLAQSAEVRVEELRSRVWREGTGRQRRRRPAP